MKKNVFLAVLIVFSIVALVLTGCGKPKLGTADNPIIMSFVPSGNTQAILTSGDSLAKMISDQTGLTVKASVGTDFTAAREAMCAGKAQMGWLNTFTYILAHEECGIDVSLVTVRNNATVYQGEIIANVNSGIKTVADLKGKTMCWVDPSSTSGYIVPRAFLVDNGVNPDKDLAKQTVSGSHPNVVTAVYNGDCDAGAVYVDARSGIAKDHPDVNDKVIVIATTSDIPNDTVSFVKDLPADTRQKIVNALLTIAGTADGKTALSTLYNITGLEAHDNTFYDPFRADLSKAGVDIESLIKK